MEVKQQNLVKNIDFEWNADTESSIHSSTGTNSLSSIHLLQQLADKRSKSSFSSG